MDLLVIRGHNICAQREKHLSLINSPGLYGGSACNYQVLPLAAQHVYWLQSSQPFSALSARCSGKSLKGNI